MFFFPHASGRTHSQAVVGEEAGDAQAAFNGVRFGLYSWKQRVQVCGLGLGQVLFRLRSHVQVLGLEGGEPPQAVAHLDGKVSSLMRRSLHSNGKF